MGTWAGHTLPGSFFVLFSLWHGVQISVRYFKSKERNGLPYKSQTYFLSPCCGGFPVESFLKVFSCALGIAGETVTGMRDGVFVNIGNSQHITMFFFFGLPGWAEILHHYKFHLPPNLVYLLHMLAFMIEGLLFYFHLHGRKAMDVQLHTLLLLVVLATVVVVFVEMIRRHSVLPALCRVFLVLLQGLWFWQVAFILYPPSGMESWDLESHEQMMICTVIFAVDTGIALMLILGIWFCVACRFNSCKKNRKSEIGGPEYSSLAMNVLRGKSGQDGLIDRVRLVDMADDSEEEVLDQNNK